MSFRLFVTGHNSDLQTNDVFSARTRHQARPLLVFCLLWASGWFVVFPGRGHVTIFLANDAEFCIVAITFVFIRTFDESTVVTEKVRVSELIFVKFSLLFRFSGWFDGWWLDGGWMVGCMYVCIDV